MKGGHSSHHKEFNDNVIVHNTHAMVHVHAKCLASVSWPLILQQCVLIIINIRWQDECKLTLGGYNNYCLRVLFFAIFATDEKSTNFKLVISWINY